MEPNRARLPLSAAPQPKKRARLVLHPPSSLQHDDHFSPCGYVPIGELDTLVGLKVMVYCAESSLEPGTWRFGRVRQAGEDMNASTCEQVYVDFEQGGCEWMPLRGNWDLRFEKCQRGTEFSEARCFGTWIKPTEQAASAATAEEAATAVAAATLTVVASSCDAALAETAENEYIDLT